MTLTSCVELDELWWIMLQLWLPGDATCIATLSGIALLASLVDIELISSSARVISIKSTKHHGVTSGPVDRTSVIPGSIKNWLKPAVAHNDVNMSSGDLRSLQ